MRPQDLITGSAYQGTQHKRRHPLIYTGETGAWIGYPIWRFDCGDKCVDLFQNEVEDLTLMEPQPEITA